MNGNDRHVEISLGFNRDDLKQGLQESERLLQESVQRMGQIQAPGDLSSFLPTGKTAAVEGLGFSPSPSQPPFPLGEYSAPPPPPSAIGPSMPNPQPMPTGEGKLEELNQRLNVIQQMAQRSPDVARANLDRLRIQSLNASVKEPEKAEEYQNLIEAIQSLNGTVRDDAKKKDQSNEFFQWIRANAAMQLGQQVVGDLQQGRFFSAMGGGAGGLLGLLVGGPAGMAVGSSVGAGLGGLIEGLAGGAQGARQYERSATDLARMFGGYGQISNLRNYNLGGQYGYTAEESLGMYDQLRQSRIVGNAAEGTPLVSEMQALTRALGMNADATIKLYAGYTQTGGDRGATGYFGEIVAGAIAAGFEANVDQYAELMNSARTQAVQGSGQGVSDRAFSMMQDVFANLTGGSSATSELMRLNPQMAGAGLNTFLGMGGTNDVYGLGAGFLRLAGVSENQLDRRFTSTEQQATNAEKALDFLGDRMIERSGMSRGAFQAAAAGDANFVQRQLQQNVGLQRETDYMLSGLLGRQASAQDLRAFEQLQNIAMANGGALPQSGASGSAEVDKLLAELGKNPADQARQAEAERHNKQMEVMSHFQDLMTRTDQWMANIYNWILENVDLEAVKETIMGVMDFVENKVAPIIVEAAGWMINEGIPKLIEAGDAVIAWAKKNDVVGKIAATMEFIVDIFKTGMDQVVGVVGAIVNPRQTLREARENPGDAARDLGGFLYSRTAPGFLSRVLRNRREADDEFEDTPAGGVVATESYNTFRFAPGDRVVASRAGSPEIGSGRESTITLDDINLLLVDFLGQVVQQHKEAMEAGELLQETQDMALELTELLQKDSEEQTGKLFPAMIKGQEAQAELTKETNQGLSVINSNLPIIGQLIAGVTDAVKAIGSVMGGSAGGMGGGGGGGAFASGLFTGPSANIGGSSAYHIDSKFSRDLSWEEIVSYFDQMAIAYAEQDRRIEFSNRGVAGQVYDHEASLRDKIKLLQQANAAHSHSVHADWYSFDYYIPQGDESRHGRSAEGAEMYLPSVAGGRAEYGSGGRYGNYVTIYDANGNPVAKTGHGDDRRALPQNRQFSDAVASSGGGNYAGVSPEFSARVQQMAQRLGMNPDHLMAVMGFETGGTYSPSVRNAAGSGATGLIQFMPSTAAGMGTSTSALAGMSAVEQLEYVERYLSPYSGQLNSLEDAYMSVLYPAAIGRGPNHGLFRRGTTAYRQNSGLDINRDGTVTVGEATNKVREYLPGGGGGASRAATGFAGSAPTMAPTEVPQFNQFTPSGGGNNIQARIEVNVNAPGGDPATVQAAAYQGTQSATDEFEQRWRRDGNPRNDDARNPVFA